MADIAQIEERVKQKLSKCKEPPKGKLTLGSENDTLLWTMKAFLQDHDCKCKEGSKDIPKKNREIGKCHKNACIEYTENKSVYSLVTGFAYSDNVGWHGHSWVVDSNDEITETTSIVRKLYYGHKLSPTEADMFCRHIIALEDFEKAVNKKFADEVFPDFKKKRYIQGIYTYTIRPNIVSYYNEKKSLPTIEELAEKLYNNEDTCSKKTWKGYLGLMVVNQDHIYIDGNGKVDILGGIPDAEKL